MTLRSITAACLIGAASALSIAQTPWMHIYYPGGYNYHGVKLDKDTEVSFDEESGMMTIDSDENPVSARFGQFDRFVVGPNVGRLDINTDLHMGGYQAMLDGLTAEEAAAYDDDITIDEILSKEVYLEADLTFDGQGLYDDVTTRVKIRGRGNSTWGMSKKPYRLKFAEKTKFGQVHKAKNLCLLANYLDPAMMKNFAAFKVGELIGMPYINRSLPVDVYLNGIYKGSYQLTEKVGINNGSVDLSKEDEPNSILFEFDTCEASEDEYPFSAENYDFPVKYKDPDAPEDEDELYDWLEYWEGECQNLMEVVADGDPAEMFAEIDLDILARYILVYNISCNQELNHPKSVYAHKTKGQKWEFGPCWDFDWAYGYQPLYDRYSWATYNNPLLATGRGQTRGGDHFFIALVNNDVFKAKFKEVWDEFYQNHRQEFFDAFDAYAASLEPQANLQGLTRSKYQNFDDNVKELRDWLYNRFEFINSDPYYGIYDPTYKYWGGW